LSNPDRHEQVGELLVAALECPPEERGKFLEEACGADALLRREVETLLRSHDAAGGFLESTALHTIGAGSQSDMEGTRLGPYRLLREIGRGGMGVVYLAVRSDEAFEKKVAVKLVKRGMDTEEIVRRFEKERRILAGLDHPNIARILDGGTTDEGLPYFVMEHVDGQPILEYCDSRGLPTNERLTIFRSVCAAVAFAHQNLVVHRDLKPSNILVDSGGVARLLDFGIAKLLADDENTTRTFTGLRPMTPGYSSPEQIRGETINTSSDVYSLGVVLYELLAGRPPYRIAGRAATDVERAVCEEDPERPSVAARDGDPKRLRRRLAGDVDTIVLKALEKDPRRRYASVEQLSEDIRRHLSGLPILARKSTFLYRSGKFVRRHAFGVAAAAAFALLAVGATATMAIQRQKTERERLRAEQTSAFLLGLFKGSDPREARGATLTVREVLDRGGERIKRELTGQPEVQASLMDTIGGVYLELGLYEQARGMFEASYQTRLRTFGARDLRVAESLESLGELDLATGKFAEAERRFREVLSLRREFLGERDLAVAETLLALGRVLHRKGEDATAVPLLRTALSIRTERLGSRDVLVANAWSVLGAALASRSEYDEAEDALRTAMEIVQGSPDPQHPGLAAYRNDLGIVLMSKGKFREAAVLYRQAADDRRKLVGEDHPTVAPLLANLAAALAMDGKTEEAEGLSRRALAIARKSLGDGHPSMAFAWQNLATVLRSKGDPDGAEEAAGRALPIFRSTLPPRHLNLSGPLLTLGWVRYARKQPVDAEPLLREALEIRRKSLKEGDWRVAEVESVLGACYSSQGRFEEASALLTRSYGVQTARLGATHQQTVETSRQLVALYEAWQKPEQAQFYRAAAAAPGPK
jgi:eukaryotic-like serine/threonine-protein kinase